MNTYEWAVNGIKLQRADAWVREQAALKNIKVDLSDPAELEAAIKARYLALGGLLNELIDGKPETPESALAQLSVPELKQLAADHNIDISNLKTKKQLVAVLDEAGVTA
jgi:hypothetical protein